MYKFPAYYFHPWLPQQWCETREGLLDLLATDELWRDTAYTNADIVKLRIERARMEDKVREAERVALLTEARHRGALQEFTAHFKEGTRIIEGHRRAIVIYPGDPQATIYIELDDGRFQMHGVVPAEDVLPDGSMRLPEPLTPLKGAGPSPLPQKNPQTPVLDLTDKEWHALPPSSKKSRVRSRKYADRDPLLKDLGYVLDAWRFYRPGKDPTLDELGNTPLPDGVKAAAFTLGLPELWPFGMSRSTLGKLLGKKHGHGINLEAFKRERSRPRRT